jgi:hypothetical protein
MPENAQLPCSMSDKQLSILDLRQMQDKAGELGSLLQGAR